MNANKLDYKKQNTVASANKLFLVFSVIFVIAQFIIGIVLSVQKRIYGIEIARKMLFDYTYLLIFFNELIIVLMPVIIYITVKKINIFKSFKFNKLKITNILLIILLSGPVYVFLNSVNALAVYFLQTYIDIPLNTIPTPKTGGEFILSLLIIAFLPAVCEELLIRGVMLNAYEKIGSVKAIVSSAVFFAIFHFDITNFMAPLFFGLIIGYVVIKTNSIYAGMLAHFLNNAIAQTLHYLLPDSYTNNAGGVIVQSKDLPGIVLFGVITLLAIFYILSFIKRSNKEIALKNKIKKETKEIFNFATNWPVLISFGLYVVITYFTLSKI